jgi:hypothetical protein
MKYFMMLGLSVLRNSIHLWGLILLVTLSCGKSDQGQLVPAYLKIEPYVANVPGGAANQKLPYAFVYVNGGDFRGGYPVPGLVPVLADGLTEVEILPGVKENGSIQTPSLFKLMRPYKTMVQLSPDSVTVIKPIVEYYAGVTSAPNGTENYDSGSVLPTDDKDTDPITGLTVTSVGGFDGKYALMQADTAHAINYVQFREPMEGLPTKGANTVMLELHYKNDQPFQVLLLGTNQSGTNAQVIPVFEFNTSPVWNKTYINLTPFLSTTTLPKYHLQFRVIMARDPATGKYIRERSSVCLDNIRVLYL